MSYCDLPEVCTRRSADIRQHQTLIIIASMAAPARPVVVNEGDVLRYQSLDSTDQALYNNLQFQYERTAFLVAVEEELGRITQRGKCSQAQGVKVLT
jgi:hypothetical protein